MYIYVGTISLFVVAVLFFYLRTIAGRYINFIKSFTHKRIDLQGEKHEALDLVQKCFYFSMKNLCKISVLYVRFPQRFDINYTVVIPCYH